MPRRFEHLGALCCALLGACMQKLDPTASSGTPDTGVEPPVEKPPSTVILPGAPPFEFYDDMGQLVNSSDACDATRAQAMGILTRSCAGCHGGRTPGERAGTPPFDYVLDPEKLMNSISSTTPPLRFVSPGEPDQSRVYLRIRRGEMPPSMPPGLPRPTVSDMSVLEEWIVNCLGPKLPPLPRDGGAD